MANAGPRNLRCPFCLSPVVPSQDGVVCSACDIPHHRECWQLNRRCTTYGCKGRANRLVLPPLPDLQAARHDPQVERPPIVISREELPVRRRHVPPGSRQHRHRHALGPRGWASAPSARQEKRAALTMAIIVMAGVTIAALVMAYAR